MPRRAAPPIAVAPVNTLLPPPPPSPLIQTLRKDYRWASISQFCWTFSDAFGLVDWDIDRLEADFDGDESQVIPDLLVKLLFALTYNRQIKRDNVMDNIRKQYEKRTRPCVLGTMEEPIEWATLGLGLKVQLLYELCEIQMEDAARFRGLLKSEEDAVSWRIDPVGWDKDGNTYFLFDDNRLWVQRQPPRPPAPARPPKKSTLKAKRALKRQRQAPPAKAPTAKKGRQSKQREDTPPVKEEKFEEPVSGSRRRTQVSFYGNVTPTVAALKRGASNSTPSTSRSTRATRANQVESKPTDPTSATPSRSQGKGKQIDTKPASLPRGTRVSRRLRDTEDEWQQVPVEWLGGEDGEASNSKRASRSSVGNGNGNGNSNSNKRKLPVDDDESELSELSDEEGRDETNGHSAASSELSDLEDEEQEDVNPKDEDDKDEDFSPTSDEPLPAKEESDVDMSEDPVKEEDEDEEEGEDDDNEEQEDEIKLAIKAADDLPEDFIEWEAVCVTLYDWRTFPEQFAKSRDPDEKALYNLLTKQVGPTIIAALVEKLQELARQEAVLNRKRSSRIATIQLSKEETLRAEAAQREMEERMERTRYESTRQEREEAELARRELERENRLKEREERALAREEAILQKAKDESVKAEQAEKDRQHRAKRREEGFTVVTPTPGEGGKSGTNQPDRWELNCEVCKKTGWNVDDDEDVVACEDCARWQHMGCHDQQDMREGRRKRNWDKVDFRCKDCLARRARQQASQSSSMPDRQRTHAPHNHSNGSAPAQHHSSHEHRTQSSPNHYPSPAGPPGLYAHQPLQPGPSRQSSDNGHQGQLMHHHPGPVDRSFQGPMASSSSRGSYPPPPNQQMGPYGNSERSAYPPRASPGGYPPSSSPRQSARGQPPYPQGPPQYPPSPYGPPPGQVARSPYHPEQALPHPQQQQQQQHQQLHGYYQNGTQHPRQTPPQHPQHLPPPHYQHLPPPPQLYPSHPSYPPRPPHGHSPPHPSQNPYQGPPGPMVPDANGHGQPSARQQQMPPQPRMHSGERERSGPAVLHNGQHVVQASRPPETTTVDQ